MKYLLLILPVLALVYCHHTTQEQTPALTTPFPVVEPKVFVLPEYNAAPSPKGDPATPTPAPLVVTYAPEQMETAYFILVRRSIQTPDGVEGILPGTQLCKVAPGQYVYRGNLLNLTTSEVTTDAELAKSLSAMNAKTQAELFYMVNKRLGYTPEMRIDPTPKAATPAAAPVATPRVQLGSSLDREAYDQREGVARSPVLRRLR